MSVVARPLSKNEGTSCRARGESLVAPAQRGESFVAGAKVRLGYAEPKGLPANEERYRGTVQLAPEPETHSSGKTMCVH